MQIRVFINANEKAGASQRLASNTLPLYSLRFTYFMRISAFYANPVYISSNFPTNAYGTPIRPSATVNVVQYEERRGQREETTRDICLRQKDKRLIGKIARKGRRRVPVAVGARVFAQRGKVGGENSVAGFVAGKGGYRAGKSILQRIKKKKKKNKKDR